jgi:hypothetical protein
MKRFRLGLFLTVGFIAMSVLPSLLTPGESGTSTLLGNMLLLLTLGELFLLVRKIPSRILSIFTTILCTVYLLLLLLFSLYRMYMGDDFDPLFLLDFLGSAPTTLLNVFGIRDLLLLLAGLLLAGILILLYWIVLDRAAQALKPQWIVCALLLTSVPLILWYPGSEQVVRRFVRTNTVSMQRNTITPVFPAPVSFEPNTTDNVFMVQLESVNGYEANGKRTISGKSYSGTYIPEMRSVAQDGVYFPYFWANEVNTNRAQEVFLCGIVGNAGRALSHNIASLRGTCLPQTLRDKGYTTLAFRSDDLSFENEGAFLSATGFEEVHQSDIMHPEDMKYAWGYDDCLFYQRVIEYLRNRFPSPQKLFVFIEVSMHHVPFDWDHPAYRSLHAFTQPTNKLESYLNSLMEQDHCVGQFYQGYQSYAAANSHLFVFGDHPWPVVQEYIPSVSPAIDSIRPDVRLTSLAYVPPRDERTQYVTGTVETSPRSESDIPPTILSLLSGKTFQNSLTYLLRKNAEKLYEDCHLLTQPFHWFSLGIIHDNRTLLKYNIESKEVSQVNVDDHFQQGPAALVGKNLSLEQFKEKYYCDRFLSADSLPAPPSPTAPFHAPEEPDIIQGHPCLGTPIITQDEYYGTPIGPFSCSSYCDKQAAKYILYKNGYATQCGIRTCRDFGEDYCITCVPPAPTLLRNGIKPPTQALPCTQ